MSSSEAWESCLWATYSSPYSLISIGMEALAALHDHTIHFTDLKTRNKLYYTIDNPGVGLGARNLAGHFSLPMFAYSETVLRPTIHIVRYPDMHKLLQLRCNNVVSYVDMLFSNYDMLITLSGFPDYSFRIWNCRTGNLLVEVATGIKCSVHSLHCSSRTWPMIMQFSKFEKAIVFWEMHYTAEAMVLHEISRVQLPKSHLLSTQFAMCSQNDVMYVVNDFGVVFSIEVAQFFLSRQWGTTFSHHDQPQPHCLFPHKQGLIVSNANSATLIILKRNNWTVEWVLKDIRVPIVKMVSNFAGEAYVTDDVGSLYQLQASEYYSTLIDFSVSNYTVEDFTILRGLKEENLLILTRGNMLCAFEISHNTKYSSLPIPNGSCVATHNSSPFAAVGTTDGKVYFLSFEKIRAPTILHIMEIDKCGISETHLANQTGLIKTMKNEYKEMVVDFKSERFLIVVPLLSRSHKRMLHFFLIDQDHALSFLSQDEIKDTDIPYADELWISAWLADKRVVNRRMYNLQKKYRSITLLDVSHKDHVELIALPVDSFSLDIYFIQHMEKVILMRSLNTLHMAYVSGVAGSNHIITYDVSTLMIHFRHHKRSSKPYVVCRKLYSSYSQRLIRHIKEIYNSKYLAVLLESGCLKISRLPPLADNLRENTEVLEAPVELELEREVETPSTASFTKHVIAKENFDRRANIDQRLAQLEEEVRALIDYDIAVTGKTQGIYRKFCLNYAWLNQLNAEARKVCEIEHNSLMDSILDKSRIRDWIMNLIAQNSLKISTKVRAIFANNAFENYSLSKVQKDMMDFFDLYRFQDFEPLEEDEETEEIVPQKEIVGTTSVVFAIPADEAEAEVEVPTAVVKKKRKLYKIVGNVFEHLMSEDFQMQDITWVTANQMCNHDIKFKVLLDVPLREEYNKLFEQEKLYKEEIMKSIIKTNASLTHIYNDTNIMLSLLGMKTFTPQQLSVPVLMNDEVLERIMTVDDSEIKAINRRAKKAVVSDQKRGRMLLWSIDFWMRALNTMMDGVLEKLWEEEIKKTPPEPEFMSKRQPHEYTLEDQKLLRIYEETLRILTEDRNKYLRILNVNERKTNELKINYIHKFNERCAQMAILKLKYDFALKHFRVRLLGLKVSFYQRVTLRNSIADLRVETEKANEYTNRYVKLIEFSEKSIADIKQDMETLNARDKTIERQFKGNFLANVPSFSHELSKLFRRRPKMQQRSFQAALVCHEVAARLVHKSRFTFPLPVEVQEYFTSLHHLDDIQNAPHQLEPRYWDQFVRLRRQKIENELKIKGQGFHLTDSQDKLNNSITDLNNLRSLKQQMMSETDRLSGQYFNIVQNQRLELVLPLGQVETSIGGSMKNLQNCILMSIDDINDVNSLIKKAGAKKLRTMQRLAVFRRQVLYKEWEHKMYRANIDYLKYMLEVVEKCKVTAEFLQLLRKWKKIKEERIKLSRIGSIDQLIEQRVTAYRKNLDRINEKIVVCKDQIVEVKRKNQALNRSIDEVKVDVALFTANRDTLLEEKLQRERNESMEKVKRHSYLINEVRQDYAHILELKTILELQRLRTFPTLGPPPDDCGQPMN
ncbi:cilia- and flagella-associated protein 43 isoform X1 [Bactrocera neohumeralis]|uniref:cilia- and flagella-associated protein 43 isoform X1 n=3 Tax=Bactrocera neohumeralis TaxID=98809 RepID=UPI002165EE2C|nr:cilia- and flagella-associated protein 43 isoform X1 [Bactrocera neohumeralis]